MAGFARTCVFAFLGGGAFVFVVACGHLPFDDLALNDDAGGIGTGTLDSGGLDAADSSVDADDAEVDAGCIGPTCAGTFVAGAPGVGDDLNPGTAAKPVQTIKKAMEIATALGGKQSVYVAAAHYPEKVVLREGIDLLGGYECSALPCTWARDILKNDTAILNPDFEGVVAPKTVSRKTFFDGFRVVGKEGTPSAFPGTAAISILSGTPTIKRCRIVGGNSNGGVTNAKRSLGVAIVGQSADSDGALLEGNSISGGASTDESYGVLMLHTVGATAIAAPVAVLTGNTIRSGTAPLTSGVVALSAGAGTLFRDNAITAGTSTNTANNSASWGVIATASTLTIDGNHINSDQAIVGSCGQGTNANFCGGILSQGATAIITNNIVFGNKGIRSCAVMITDSEAAVGSVVLNANTLDGAGVGSDGTISAAIAVRISEGSTATIGKARNNILLGGANKNRYGVYEEIGPVGKQAHLAALDNNDFWNAGPPRNDFAYHLWNGSVETNLTFAQLGNLTTPTPSPNTNIAVDPLLDPTYHLTSTSQCIDKGTLTEAPQKDIDGDSRPRNNIIDIGADEAK